MNTLSELCFRHNCDKGLLSGGVGHGYDKHYEAILEPLRDNPIRLLEIGVGDGKSIMVWLEYFTHPNTMIHGVDNDPNCSTLRDDRFQLIRGDQSDPQFLSSLVTTNLVFGNLNYDVIIDDGSHLSNGIIPSFEALWPFVKSGGYYCIEDLRCSYMGSGYQVTGWPTQMEFIKKFLDDINAQTDYKPAPDSVFNYPQGTDGKRGIEWMKFSPELCILKKA